MPDIWTKHPDIVKALLEEAGFRCGVEPRILKPRDPNWTCVIDGEKVASDLYIHPLSEIAEGKVQMRLSGGGELLFVLMALTVLIRSLGRRWQKTSL